jgi:hypothetical protein
MDQKQVGHFMSHPSLLEEQKVDIFEAAIHINQLFVWIKKERIDVPFLLGSDVPFL